MSAGETVGCQRIRRWIQLRAWAGELAFQRHKQHCRANQYQQQQHQIRAPMQRFAPQQKPTHQQRLHRDAPHIADNRCSSHQRSQPGLIDAQRICPTQGGIVQPFKYAVPERKRQQRKRAQRQQRKDEPQHQTAARHRQRPRHICLAFWRCGGLIG